MALAIALSRRHTTTRVSPLSQLFEDAIIRLSMYVVLPEYFGGGVFNIGLHRW